MTPKLITLHCAATPNGKPFFAEDIRAWHLARGFKDIGYHRVICIDGGVQTGRPDDQLGAHVLSHNEGNLGVCMIGTDKFCHPQFESLRWVLEHWMSAYNIHEEQLFGHYQWDTAIAQGKTCPNMDMGKIKLWLRLKDDKLLEPYLLPAIMV